MSGRVRVFRAKEVNKLLGYKECIEALKDVLKQSAEGSTVNPLRNVMSLPNKTMLITMPGYVQSGNYLGLKAVGIFPNNTQLNIDTHQGVVLLLDANSGLLKAIFDACSVTAIRTAAASAVATDILARDDVSTLGIIGTGAQAQSHIEAICAVRNIKDVLIWGRSFDKSQSIAALYSSSPFSVKAVESLEEVVRNSDVICTVTGTKEPIIKGEWIKEGTHLNVVGSCTPTNREVDTLTITRSKVFADSVVSLLNEAGDFIIPLNEGAIEKSHCVGELGEILVGKVDGRTSSSDITLFKSLGVAIEDVASARVIYEKSLDLDPSDLISFDFY